MYISSNRICAVSFTFKQAQTNYFHASIIYDLRGKLPGLYMRNLELGHSHTDDACCRLVVDIEWNASCSVGDVVTATATVTATNATTRRRRHRPLSSPPNSQSPNLRET